MTPSQFSAWLHALDLNRYVQIFVDNDVDFSALNLLSDKELQELGVSLGHRKKLLKALADLAESSTPVPTAEFLTGQRPPVLSTQAEGERRSAKPGFKLKPGFVAFYSLDK